VSARFTPIQRLIPDKYSDLTEYLQGLENIIQEQGAAITNAAAATSLTPPAGGTGAAAGGYDTAANRDLMITSLSNLIVDVADIRTQFNDLLVELRAEGTIET